MKLKEIFGVTMSCIYMRFQWQLYLPTGYFLVSSFIVFINIVICDRGRGHNWQGLISDSHSGLLDCSESRLCLRLQTALIDQDFQMSTATDFIHGL